MAQDKTPWVISRLDLIVATALATFIGTLAVQHFGERVLGYLRGETPDTPSNVEMPIENDYWFVGSSIEGSYSFIDLNQIKIDDQIRTSYVDSMTSDRGYSNRIEYEISFDCKNNRHRIRSKTKFLSDEDFQYPDTNQKWEDTRADSMATGG